MRCNLREAHPLLVGEIKNFRIVSPEAPGQVAGRMATHRAGRTAAAASRPQSPLPSPQIVTRGAVPTTRRRAALSHTGHAVGDMSGFDGEVCVRYEAVYRRAEPASGERRLLLAVLEDGIRTFLKNARATHGRASNLRREALSWLVTEDRSDVFAFENICEALGIDAQRLRQRVMAEAAHEPTHSVH